MKIAIIGAGYAGLGSAWYLIHEGCEVTLFDQCGVGFGASGIAAGLLHPFQGKEAKLHEFGIQGMEETLNLIKEVEYFVKETIFEKVGIVRFIDSKYEQIVKQQSLQGYYEWIDAKEALKKYDVLNGCVFIKNAGVLDSSAYLRGLFELLKTKGLFFEKRKIYDINELNHFDAILVAAGSWSLHIKGVKLDLYAVKGQLIVTNKLVVPPRMHGIYALSRKEQGIIGATFEKHFDSELPDEKCIQKVLEQSIKLGIARPNTYEIKASLRAYSKAGYPIAKQLNEKLFVLVGLGSRGILLHALFACILAKKITSNRVLL